MRPVLGIATIIGVFAMLRSFGIFYLGDALFHLDHGMLMTLVYLNLSIGGHLTLFVSRTRGPFWTIKPARILLFAVIGTQIIATFIAVYGFLMSPLGWYYAGIVWAYCLVVFIIQDFVKLAGYRILGVEHSGYFGRHVRPEDHH
jgi:H+-transporting ATPase